jgi:membrane-bound serine protease (ClpP class)
MRSWRLTPLCYLLPAQFALTALLAFPTRNLHTPGVCKFPKFALAAPLAFAILPTSTNPQAMVGQPGLASQADSPRVLLLTADGPLTPAMFEYLKRGLQSAALQNAELLILKINTPGGSIDLMNRMVQVIRASQVPVVVYVAPRGAMAGSAGSVITLAGHMAAMSPETAIGAASPVGMQGEELGQTIQAKEKNILKATVRSLTEGRSSEAISLAESMIESAQAVSANEALQSGLVDFIAIDTNDLLQQLNGVRVKTAAGVRTLNTAHAEVQEQTTSFIEDLLAIFTNPNVVFLLITIGVQAILIEMSSPGGWVAGFLGAVCLALAFYGLGVLDVNWFGAVFLIIAFALFILDIKAPTHGALTIAGVASLIVGALVLFNSPSLPAFQPRVSIPLVVIMSLITGGVFFGVVLFAVRAQKIPIRVGIESLVGKKGWAITEIGPGRSGQVQVASEQWTADLAPGEQEIPRAAPIEVVQVAGLRLVVKKV